MKLRIFTLAALFIFVAAIATANNVSDFMYEGIAKVKGHPMDFWTTINFNGDQARIKLASSVTIKGGYSLTSNGDKCDLIVDSTTGKHIELSSADGGSTFEGTVPFRGGTAQVWLLRVPKEHAPCSMADNELDKIVGSSDGYTAFVRIKMQNMLMSATSDFSLDVADHSFSMKCDTEGLQKIFSTMHGSYKVADGKIVMEDSIGMTVTGTVYDNGSYIIIPMASSAGTEIELVLIR